MTDTPGTASQPASALEDVLPKAIQVVTDPGGFFENMPREGGYEAPGIFAAVMLIANGAVFGLISLFHLHFGGFFMSLIFMPVLGAIGLLIGAAILFFLSRALGGAATFESSFRIVAYSSVFAPLGSVASLVPYLSLLVQAYALYVAILAVIAVHKVPEQKAWTVIGGLGAVLLLLTFWTTVTARRMAPRIDEFNRHMQEGAEDLGKASENFQKELGKAMEKMGKDIQQRQEEE